MYSTNIKSNQWMEDNEKCSELVENAKKLWYFPKSIYNLQIIKLIDQTILCIWGLEKTSKTKVPCKAMNYFSVTDALRHVTKHRIMTTYGGSVFFVGLFSMADLIKLGLQSKKVNLCSDDL